MEQSTTKKRVRSKEKKEYYVSPKEFYKQLQKYDETNVFDDQLAESIFKIATGLSYASNFINYTFKEDMVGDAVVKMIAATQNKKFDLESDNNPFSYYTTIAYNAFINRIKKEKKYRQTVSDYQEKMYEEIMTESSNGKVYVHHPEDESNFE